MEARTKPISLTDDVSVRVLPFLHQAMKNYGKLSYSWAGTTPRLMIMNPEHVKEIFNRVYDFPKPEVNPLVKLSTGVARYNGEKWAKHRRIINPAFYVEKLKNMVPAFYQSCSEMINGVEELVSEDGSPHEVDVWPWLQNLASDVISRTAFSSSYNEGRAVFELLKEQAKLSQLILQTLYIPGLR
ncbi:PREDICTED: cytochrome P450 72A15-like [Tarenaya hassleriana]|uniref:cytochrome P450 72A15-like n=1 Tax=Tarenaya hassleriana TaxID=28532 RepID=UPI0008FD7828|nr:PREDICTED: cytochrome P450 72A15-like [Tarenaya hassleriana]